MPIQPIDFPRFSFDELNPLLTGVRSGQDIFSNAIKNRYLPMTSMAKAASEMAYARLMGPQFIAKLMGNKDVLANLDDPSKAVNDLYNTGTGAGNPYGTGQPGTQGTNGSSFNPYVQQELKNNPRQVLSQRDQQGSDNLKPGQSYVIKDNPSSNANNDRGDIYDKKTGFFENVGNAKGLEKEGEKLGEERGSAIAELGNEYADDTEAMKPLNHLMQLSQSPIFMNLRKNIPLFQGLQLSTLSKLGDPEQQRMIGDFITSSKTAVANTVNSFKGRAMAKEFDFGNMLKINDDDTLPVILGKLESLSTYKQATMQRNRVASYFNAT